MSKRVKVTRNFQVTVPAEIRRTLGIKQGDWLEFDTESDKIIVRKLVGDRVRTIRLGRKLTIEEIDRLIEEGLRQSARSDH
ncbi:AbrB family transcriptional regulator [Candidatus Marsarchaeota G2 archaeon ECH_B_2]|uniref:AbrB family transcriptional regulator n=3 Tax=Candidatus Marsarchaeota group 2 TaxID=2203771 RepID=A0A2R6B6Z1_9ARCH|nr:MAG: AbrB family transcriptional regulator [Candidatus Marsarchaeota G2 archaeon ECH_B_2]PSN98504.1 MAG: AbrB family transcriptional regulator [Candidatus Marsarchaeota G2 archaeon ECH_B_3]PSO01512.1 MAG: AbrB family transcriptional regulator [Candidatus Marsarchaeota G2 archaeon ECH_B_1]